MFCRRTQPVLVLHGTDLAADPGGQARRQERAALPKATERQTAAACMAISSG